MPDATGLSCTGLYYTKESYLFYSQWVRKIKDALCEENSQSGEIVQQLVGQLHKVLDSQIVQQAVGQFLSLWSSA